MIFLWLEGLRLTLAALESFLYPHRSFLNGFLQTGKPFFFTKSIYHTKVYTQVINDLHTFAHGTQALGTMTD